MAEYEIIIGIDAGTKTGLAQYNVHLKMYQYVFTMMIHEALSYVEQIHKSRKILVVVEDARKATFGWTGANRGRLQGAGSVKRDAAIWEDFLKDKNIPHIMKRPDKSKTKWPEHLFKAVTGYNSRTSEHGRDAAMLIINYCR